MARGTEGPPRTEVPPTKEFRLGPIPPRESVPMEPSFSVLHAGLNLHVIDGNKDRKFRKVPRTFDVVDGGKSGQSDSSRRKFSIISTGTVLLIGATIPISFILYPLTTALVLGTAALAVVAYIAGNAILSGKRLKV